MRYILQMHLKLERWELLETFNLNQMQHLFSDCSGLFSSYYFVRLSVLQGFEAGPFGAWAEESEGPEERADAARVNTLEAKQ